MERSSKTKSFWDRHKGKFAVIAGLLALGVGYQFVHDVTNEFSKPVSVFDVHADNEDDKENGSYAFANMSALMAAYYSNASSPSAAKQEYGGWAKADGEAAKDPNAQAEDKVGGEKTKQVLLTDIAYNSNDNDDKGNKKYEINQRYVIKGSKNIAGGGALLGYPDNEYIKKGGFLSFLSSLSSKATIEYSYDSLKTGDGLNSLEAYAYYGAALNALGMDRTQNAVFDLSMIPQAIGGAIMWLLYYLLYIVNITFKIVLEILQIINPFYWFSGAVTQTYNATVTPIDGQGTSYTQQVDNHMNVDALSDAGGRISGKFQELVGFVSKIYTVFYGFGWVAIVPCLIGVLFCTWVFKFNGSQQAMSLRFGRTRRIVFYILFLAFGVPFIGTTYTAGLDGLIHELGGPSLTSNSNPADRLVLSAFLDNQRWIEEQRMAIPSQAVIEWNRKTNEVTDKSMQSIQKSTFAINNLSYNIDNLSNANGGAQEDDRNSSSAWNSNNNWRDTNGGKNSAHDIGDIGNMLIRYMARATYEAGTWETSVKSYLNSQTSAESGFNESDADGKTLSWSDKIKQDALNLTLSPRFIPFIGGLTQNGLTPLKVEVKDKAFFLWDNQKMNFGNNIFTTNGLVSATDGGGAGAGGIQGDVDGDVVKLKNNYRVTKALNKTDGFDYSKPRAMSYLAMYNYLNSSFDATKITSYSTTSAITKATKQVHMSVNMVGASTVQQILIFWSVAVVMLALVAVGLTYAFGLLVMGYKRSIQIFYNIIKGTAGMMEGIVGVISQVVLILAEIMTTMIFYTIITELLYALPTVIADSVNGAIDSIFGGATIDWGGIGFGAIDFSNVLFGSAGGFWVMILSYLITIPAIFWLIPKMIQIRPTLMTAVSNEVEGAIRRFFYADDSQTATKQGGEASLAYGSYANDMAVNGFTSGFVSQGEDINNDGDDESNIENVNEDGDDPDGPDGDDDPTKKGGHETTVGSNDDKKEAGSKETEEKGKEVGENGEIDRSQSEASSESPLSASEAAEQLASGLNAAGEALSEDEKADLVDAIENGTEDGVADGAEVSAGEAAKQLASGKNKHGKPLSKAEKAGLMAAIAGKEKKAAPVAAGEKQNSSDKQEASSKKPNGAAGLSPKEAAERLASGVNEKGEALSANEKADLIAAIAGEGSEAPVASAEPQEGNGLSVGMDEKEDGKEAPVAKGETNTSKRLNAAKKRAGDAKDSASKSAQHGKNAIAKTASGGANVGSGLARIASGDVAGGALQTAQGLKEMGSGVKDGAKSGVEATKSGLVAADAAITAGIAVGEAAANTKAGQAAISGAKKTSRGIKRFAAGVQNAYAHAQNASDQALANAGYMSKDDANANIAARNAGIAARTASVAAGEGKTNASVSGSGQTQTVKSNTQVAADGTRIRQEGDVTVASGQTQVEGGVPHVSTLTGGGLAGLSQSIDVNAPFAAFEAFGQPNVSVSGQGQGQTGHVSVTAQGPSSTSTVNPEVAIVGGQNTVNMGAPQVSQATTQASSTVTGNVSVTANGQTRMQASAPNVSVAGGGQTSTANVSSTVQGSAQTAQVQPSVNIIGGQTIVQQAAPQVSQSGGGATSTSGGSITAQAKNSGSVRSGQPQVNVTGAANQVAQSGSITAQGPTGHVAGGQQNVSIVGGQTIVSQSTPNVSTTGGGATTAPSGTINAQAPSSGPVRSSQPQVNVSGTANQMAQSGSYTAQAPVGTVNGGQQNVTVVGGQTSINRGQASVSYAGGGNSNTANSRVFANVPNQNAQTQQPNVSFNRQNASSGNNTTRVNAPSNSQQQRQHVQVDQARSNGQQPQAQVHYNGGGSANARANGGGGDVRTTQPQQARTAGSYLRGGASAAGSGLANIARNSYNSGISQSTRESIVGTRNSHNGQDRRQGGGNSSSNDAYDEFLREATTTARMKNLQRAAYRSGQRSTGGSGYNGGTARSTGGGGSLGQSRDHQVDGDKRTNDRGREQAGVDRNQA